jgi:hypothetical protein
MSDIGLMARFEDLVRKSGLMVRNSKESTRQARKTDRESSDGAMAFLRRKL